MGPPRSPRLFRVLGNNSVAIGVSQRKLLGQRRNISYGGEEATAEDLSNPLL